MCDDNGCGNGCCQTEDIEDQEAFLKEREAILEAKLATVRHLLKTIGKKSKSDDK